MLAFLGKEMNIPKSGGKHWKYDITQGSILCPFLHMLFHFCCVIIIAIFNYNDSPWKKKKFRNWRVVCLWVYHSPPVISFIMPNRRISDDLKEASLRMKARAYGLAEICTITGFSAATFYWAQKRKLLTGSVDEPANSLTAYFRNSRDLSRSLERAGAITRIRDILPTTHDLFQLIPTPSDPFRPISR